MQPSQLKALRLTTGKTPEGFEAELGARVGMSPGYIRRLEKGILLQKRSGSEALYTMYLREAAAKTRNSTCAK